MKYCPKCGKTKNKTEFFRDKSRKDGCATACKECRLIYVLKYQKTEKWKEINRVKVARYKLLHPDKVKARNKARKQSKYLKKGGCEKCGRTTFLQMHHPDYNKPLFVTTLCHNCHVEHHTRANAENKAK